MDGLETNNIGPRRHPSLDWTQREIGCPGVVFKDADYDRFTDFRAEHLLLTGDGDGGDDDENEDRYRAALFSGPTENDAIN